MGGAFLSELRNKLCEDDARCAAPREDVFQYMPLAERIATTGRSTKTADAPKKVTPLSMPNAPKTVETMKMPIALNRCKTHWPREQHSAPAQRQQAWRCHHVTPLTERGQATYHWQAQQCLQKCLQVTQQRPSSDHDHARRQWTIERPQVIRH